MTNKIVIVGSINVDNILHISALPKPGETISMTSFSKAAGGKGANQAVAAARAGAQTAFVGRVGDDDNGTFMLTQLKANGISTDDVKVTAGQQTGQAYILLQASGQNSIIVQHGANFEVTPKDVDVAQTTIERAEFTIAQFETPVPATLRAFQLAHAAHGKTILNPAPAMRELPEALLRETDIITPNETESESLSGVKVTDEASLKQSAAYFHGLGIAAVVITLGSKGAYVSAGSVAQIIPAFKTQAVDTTAAGDTFIGAMAAELRPDLSNLVAATTFASMASAFTVQKMGAFPSIPKREVVVKALSERR